MYSVGMTDDQQAWAGTRLLPAQQAAHIRPTRREVRKSHLVGTKRLEFIRQELCERSLRTSDTRYPNEASQQADGGILVQRRPKARNECRIDLHSTDDSHPDRTKNDDASP
jgi:hypothetical protein